MTATVTAPPTRPSADPRRPALGRLVGSESFALALCLAAFAAFAPFTPGFASPGNLANILQASLPLLVLATGQTLVLIAGGIDLSVTATIGLASVAGSLVMGGEHGWLAGHPLATAVATAAMLATGLLVGAFNGLCIAGLRMPAFMVSLASMMTFGGLAVWLAQRAAGSESIHRLPLPFIAAFGHPAAAATLALLVPVLAHLFLHRTLPGRWLQALGGNPETARISGVPVATTTAAAYALAGLAAAIAAVLLTARLETGSATHGRTLLLDVLGAAVLGGTSLTGGRGSIPGTVFGVLFLAILGNGLNLLNVSDFLITLVKGAVILLAALLDGWRSRLAATP